MRMTAVGAVVLLTACQTSSVPPDTIGGHPTLVVTGVLHSDSAGASRVAAATWRDVPALRGGSEQAVHLTMWGEVRDTSRIADVLAILHSVRFTP